MICQINQMMKNNKYFGALRGRIKDNIAPLEGVAEKATNRSDLTLKRGEGFPL